MLYFSVTTISLHVYLLSVSYSNFFYKLINVHFDKFIDEINTLKYI